MDTWGYDIFDNDVATDVRSLFDNEMNIGDSVMHATSVVLREWSEALDDPEDGPRVWLALAALQADRHAVHDNVRNQALHVIDSGAGLAGWDQETSPEEYAERKRVLEELRARLVPA
jgi:hypothetical protein